jgi:hypothetical protein
MGASSHIASFIKSKYPQPEAPSSPPLLPSARTKEDRVTGLREPLLTATTFEDAPRAALRRVGRNCADVAPVHPLIMITHGIGTRLIPIFSFSQEPSLLLSSFLSKTNSSLGSSLFQSISG